MPARNVYHDSVVRALTADGWVITHDPLRVSFGDRDVSVDLGARREAIAAEKNGRLIAVETHSFTHVSPVHDLHSALGQYELYRLLLAKTEPSRVLFLAVPQGYYESELLGQFGSFVVAAARMRLLGFDPANARIVRWIDPTQTEVPAPPVPPQSA